MRTVVSRIVARASGAAKPARALLAALLALLVAMPAAAQRRHLIELSAGGAYNSYDEATDLDGAAGGFGRLAVWLPLRLALEGEGIFASPKTSSAGNSVSVRTIAGSLLYNVPIGESNWFYLKAGVGSQSFGGDCPTVSIPGTGPCGSTSAFLGGFGFRVGLTPTIFVRPEAVMLRSRIDRSDAIGEGERFNVTNYGINVGLSLMVASRRIVDSDRDGILDTADRCADTEPGVLTDSRGCPGDSDEDGVPDGVDRCPTSRPGDVVDEVGCTRDSDRDGVNDIDDRCNDTPAGAVVDANGCPSDSDRDKVFDGLDRCGDTPAGATVDSLGCPNDGDGDGVFDGLDRCPNSDRGIRPNTFGCPSGQVAGAPPPAAADTGLGAIARGRRATLRGVTFTHGSARLAPSSFPVLDSVAAILLANPNLRVEIGGHSDVTGSNEESLYLSRLRAEAVRNYLINRGVPFQWMTAKGYGNTQPVTRDITEAGRAQNRRVEIKPVTPGGGGSADAGPPPADSGAPPPESARPR